MSRVFNFSAGPAAIPDAVLDRIRDDIPDWNGTGMSVMEVSHRARTSWRSRRRPRQDLRSLLAVPDDYSVLFPAGRRDAAVRHGSPEPGGRGRHR